MAVTFQQIPQQTPRLACETCGCEVSGRDQDRAAHERWHDQQDEHVIELSRLERKISA